MAAKYNSAFRNYTMDVLNFGAKLIGHQEYEATLCFQTECHESDGCEDGVLANIAIDNVYLNTHINIFPGLLNFWLRGDLLMVAKSLLHEVVHLLTDPMVQIAYEDASPSREKFIRATNERQTQRITTALHNALPVGWYKPERLKKLLTEYGA